MRIHIHHKARLGKARQGAAWLGEAGQGAARQGFIFSKEAIMRAGVNKMRRMSYNSCLLQASELSKLIDDIHRKQTTYELLPHLELIKYKFNETLDYCLKILKEEQKKNNQKYLNQKQIAIGGGVYLGRKKGRTEAVARMAACSRKVKDKEAQLEEDIGNKP